jgi:fructose-bisphosphate aldolase class 1
MADQELESVALTLVADGKGILATDETVPDTGTDCNA